MHPWFVRKITLAKLLWDVIYLKVPFFHIPIWTFLLYSREPLSISMEKWSTRIFLWLKQDTGPSEVRVMLSDYCLTHLWSKALKKKEWLVGRMRLTSTNHWSDAQIANKIRNTKTFLIISHLLRIITFSSFLFIFLF